MTVAVRLAVVGLALLGSGAWGCNARFVFDPQARDGATPADARAEERSEGLDAARPDFDPPPSPLDARPSADSTAPASPDGAGRGDDASPAGPSVCSDQSPVCLCSGSLCSCSRLQWCRFEGNGCGPTSGTCSFFCHNGTRCEGQCQHGCRVECENNSTCDLTMGESSTAEAESSVLTVTVGAMSRVQCENNATCHVRCTSSCVLACAAGAHCDLRCASDAAPHPADGGGSCPR